MVVDNDLLPITEVEEEVLPPPLEIEPQIDSREAPPSPELESPSSEPPELTLREPLSPQHQYSEHKDPFVIAALANKANITTLLQPKINDGSNLVNAAVGAKTNLGPGTYASGAQQIVNTMVNKIESGEITTFASLLDEIGKERHELQTQLSGDPDNLHGTQSELFKIPTQVGKGIGKYSKFYNQLSEFIKGDVGSFREVTTFIKDKPIVLSRAEKIDDKTISIAYTDTEYDPEVKGALEELWQGSKDATKSVEEKLAHIALIDGILLRSRPFAFGSKSIADMTQEILVRLATGKSLSPYHPELSRDFSAFSSTVNEYAKNWMAGKFCAPSK